MGRWFDWKAWVGFLALIGFFVCKSLGRSGRDIHIYPKVIFRSLTQSHRSTKDGHMDIPVVAIYGHILLGTNLCHNTIA